MIEKIIFEAEDVLDLCSEYNRKGRLGEAVLYFVCDLLNVSSDMLYEMLEEYEKN